MLHSLHPPGGTGLELSADCLTVKYTIDARHSSDVGAIQTRTPVPLSKPFFYFELKVIESGEEGRIAIGYSDRAFSMKLNRQPGWETGSYGYHGDDGKKFGGNGKGVNYAEGFSKGDVVGALYHLSNNSISFTKNGVLLRLAFTGVRGELYPTIGLHSKGEVVRVNFGEEPFLFDLEAYSAEETRIVLQQVERTRASSVSSRLQHELVRQFLLTQGFGDTLLAFDRESGAETPRPGLSDGGLMDYDPIPSSSNTDSLDLSLTAWATLNVRSEVRAAVMKGDVVAAASLVKSSYPTALADSQGGASAGGASAGGASASASAHFMVSIQTYIEMLRQGKIEEAVKYSQETLSPLYASVSVSGCQDKESLLRESVALVAYEHLATSPLSHLLGSQQREATADSLNSAILSYHKSSLKTGLHALLTQSNRVERALVEAAGDQGTVLAFSLLA